MSHKISPFVSLFGGNNLNIAVLTDFANGDKGKLEKLRKSEILHAGHLFTAADFTGTSEADIEDFFHPALYAKLLNGAFNLQPQHQLNEQSLLAADSTTTRLLKKAEAAFRVMGNTVPEFNHYAPAEYLMRNPSLLEGNTPEITDTLAKFERAIVALNKCLPAK